MSKETTAFICGGKPNHKHNEDHIFLQMFDGAIYSGAPEELEEQAKEAQMWSKCCSICGSSNFGRDVYYGLE